MIIGRLSEILVPEKDPKLNEHFNICIFFLASATLENEWINTNLKKKEILQKLDELAKENTSYKIVSINIDDEDELAEDYDVASIPCLVVFKDGKEVNRSIGLIPKDAIAALMEE